MQIGDKLYKKDKTYENYANMAVWCNSNNALIEDKGEYYEIVAFVPRTPTIKEQLIRLETSTGLIRSIRELILAPNSEASDYVKTKAQEIENIAEQIRGEE